MSIEPKQARRRVKQPRIPRFADPWRFRERSQRSEAVADFSGRPIQPRFYRRGGVSTYATVADETPSKPGSGSGVRTRSSAADLRRRQSAAFALYRCDGWCTAVELATIEALWFEGLSLRGLARRDKVSPAAISDRISGLRHKAPHFWNWWRAKNQGRRGASPRPW